MIQACTGDDRVLGYAGDDRVRLGIGNDRAFLGRGHDSAPGGAGDERVRAAASDDTVNGEVGNDRLASPTTDAMSPTEATARRALGAGQDRRDGPGDVVRGVAGNDRIRVRDGELDVISCGSGFDVALIDLVDVIEGSGAATPDGDCERVRSAVPRPRDDMREREG